MRERPKQTWIGEIEASLAAEIAGVDLGALVAEIVRGRIPARRTARGNYRLSPETVRALVRGAA